MAEKAQPKPIKAAALKVMSHGCRDGETSAGRRPSVILIFHQDATRWHNYEQPISHGPRSRAVSLILTIIYIQLERSEARGPDYAVK